MPAKDPLQSARESMFSSNTVSTTLAVTVFRVVGAQGDRYHPLQNSLCFIAQHVNSSCL